MARWDLLPQHPIWSTRKQSSPAVGLEKYPEPLRDGEDDLAVRDIQEKYLPHPLAPLLQAFGIVRRTKSAGAAGEKPQETGQCPGAGHVSLEEGKKL